MSAIVPASTVPLIRGTNEPAPLHMPQLGLGTYKIGAGQVERVVRDALDVGYRHIDTAAAYGNEREVGQGIRRSGVPRENVFLETKIWASDYGHDETLHAFDKAIAKLDTDTIDLLILHQPMPAYFSRTVAAYQALAELYEAGRVRAIGVSNFTEELLDRLAEWTDTVPAVNQVELHPYFSQPELQAYHRAHGILTQAWSPIGGITFYPGWGEGRHSVMDDQTLQRIAAGTGKSAAQVMLRWHLQQGRSAIPKSTNPERIAQNFDIFDFELSADQLVAIDALDRGVRNGPDPTADNARYMELTIPEA